MQEQNPKPKAQSPQLLWWQTGIIYQIYPRSFQDSNGDGIGDLAGITSRLDYLEWLKVDAIWISPIYPSPMADFGYDVTDYTDVDPIFGTLADFDRLVAEAHARGLKIILDFVPNHTSDRHAWFSESRSSRDNPRRDWYIWADAAPGGGPPNNWLSAFGGGAWEWDEVTSQYYLHTFLKEQPDLNWRNPAAQQAMLDAMRFWLDRGVDGFRVDVINVMVKDQLLRDNPPNPKYRPSADSPAQAVISIFSQNRPEVHEIIRQMRELLNSYNERMMVGETYMSLGQLMKYYGERNDEIHLPFNFGLIWPGDDDDEPPTLPWQARAVRRIVDEYEAALPPGAWPNWVLGNHDQHRLASRIGVEQARVAQMLLLTLRGTPTCYYGDEIGMTDVGIPANKVQDPFELQVPGLGLGRDPERTPMQWDASPNAGFSTAEPWLPIAGNYRQVNVAVERDAPTSMLALFQTLTTLRRDTPALNRGSYRSVDTRHEDVFAYTREHEDTRMLIALNFGSATHRLDLSSVERECQVVLSTSLDRSGSASLSSLQLRPNEGIVVDVKRDA